MVYANKIVVSFYVFYYRIRQFRPLIPNDAGQKTMVRIDFYESTSRINEQPESIDHNLNLPAIRGEFLHENYIDQLNTNYGLGPYL